MIGGSFLQGPLNSLSSSPRAFMAHRVSTFKYHSEHICQFPKPLLTQFAFIHSVYVHHIEPDFQKS